MPHSLLFQAHLEKLLKESTLTEESLTKLGWRSVTNEEALQLLKRSGGNGVPESGGIWIPYVDPVQSVLTGHGRGRFDRAECRNPAYRETIAGHGEALGYMPEPQWIEAPKYLGPAGEPTRLYVPHPICPAILDPAEPLWVVEGEKKSVAGCQVGLATVALPGVDNFGDSRARYESWGAGKDERRLHSDFSHLKLQGREVVICFDSDMESNPRVLGAAALLGTLLGEAGAKVQIAYINGEGA